MNINRREDVYIASSLFLRYPGLRVVSQTLTATIYNFVQFNTTMHNPVYYFDVKYNYLQHLCEFCRKTRKHSIICARLS